MCFYFSRLYLIADSGLCLLTQINTNPCSALLPSLVSPLLKATYFEKTRHLLTVVFELACKKCPKKGKRHLYPSSASFNHPLSKYLHLTQH